MKSLFGSTKDFVPGRPADVRRWLLSSMRWDDLLARFRLPLDDTFIVSVAAAEAAPDDDDGRE